MGSRVSPSRRGPAPTPRRMNVDRFSASPRTDTTINRYPNDPKIHTASHACASTKAGFDRRSTKYLLVATSGSRGAVVTSTGRRPPSRRRPPHRHRREVRIVLSCGRPHRTKIALLLLKASVLEPAERGQAQRAGALHHSRRRADPQGPARRRKSQRYRSSRRARHAEARAFLVEPDLTRKNELDGLVADYLATAHRQFRDRSRGG